MVKCLEEEGVTRIFGYPGVAISPFYEAYIMPEPSSMSLSVKSRRPDTPQAAMPASPERPPSASHLPVLARQI